MNTPFADYAAFERYLDKLGLFHMDLGLARVARALARLGLARPPYAVAQVVGTNGKGSTAAYLAGLAQERGLRAGLFTSPHFLTPRERVRVDGAMLDEETWTELANRVFVAGTPETAMSETGAGTGAGTSGKECELTYFEFLTVLAALAFSMVGHAGPKIGHAGPNGQAGPKIAQGGRGVDLAVFEAGLGGTHDATTAVAADMVLFTRIGLDHQAVLGDTLQEIARDKGGAMRPATPALTVDQSPEVMAELAAMAEQIVMTDLTQTNEAKTNPPPTAIPRKRGNRPRLRRAELDAVADALAPGSPAFPGGPHQSANARLAIAAFNDLALTRHWRPYDEFDAEDVPDIFDRSRPAGRFQLVYEGDTVVKIPEWILDGAHNADALRATRNALAATRLAPRAIVFTCLADKNLDELAPLVASFCDCPVHVPELDALGRERPAAEVACALGGRSHAHADMAAALAAAQKEPGIGPVLVCGSLYLLAQFYTLRPDCLK